MSEQQQTLVIQQAIDLGVQHHSAGELTKAEGIYKQILQSGPNQPVAMHLLARHDRRDTGMRADNRTGASGKRPKGQFRPPPPPIGPSSHGIDTMMPARGQRLALWTVSSYAQAAGRAPHGEFD